MLNRRNYTKNGHDWNPMSDMELESLRGVSYFWRGGSRKGDLPPEPPSGYGPDLCIQHNSCGITKKSTNGQFHRT